jgi:hypothetical protein
LKFKQPQRPLKSVLLKYQLGLFPQPIPKQKDWRPPTPEESMQRERRILFLLQLILKQILFQLQLSVPK